MGNIEEFGLPGLPLILLGNKADLEGKREVVIVISAMVITFVLQVERERGEALAREHSMAFLETSARTGVNVAQAASPHFGYPPPLTSVAQAFHSLAETILDRRLGEEDRQKSLDQPISVSPNRHSPKQRQCCSK